MTSPSIMNGGLNYNCKVCERRDGSAVDAVQWCTVCEECLCQSCNEVHKFSLSSRNHNVITLENYNKLPPFISSLKQRCEKHNELYKLYCSAHKEPCCCECASVGHKTCHGFQSLDILIKGLSTTPFLDLECAVNELNINIQNVLDNRTEALKTLNTHVKKVTAEITRKRGEVNVMLDTMEKDILHQLSVKHANYKANIEDVISVLQEKKIALDDVERKIEEMKEFASDHQVFLGSRLLNSKLERQEQHFRQLFDTEHTLRQKDAYFTFTPGLVVSEGNLLGRLDVERISCEIPIKKNESLGAELPFDILHNLDAVQMRTRTQFKFYDGIVTRNLAGCAFLENCQVLFPDWSDNNELLFFDESGKNRRNIVLDKKAFDIVYVGQNCVALTFPDSKRMSILDLTSKHEKYHVTFENRCWGITHTENNLFVREFSVGIHCFDMEGKLLKTLPMSGYITHIASYDGKLYYTEHTPDVVHCCDIDGNEIWQLAIDGQPKGITAGKYGFVFVVLEKECKLLVISPDGKKFREILNAENGLQEPHAIAYDMCRNKLILVKDKTGLAELYDIIY